MDLRKIQALPGALRRALDVKFVASIHLPRGPAREAWDVSFDGWLGIGSFSGRTWDVFRRIRRQLQRRRWQRKVPGRTGWYVQHCHTEHSEKGELVREKYLKGTILPFKPLVPMPVWADKSTAIVGLPGWTEAAAIRFLMTGIAYNNLPARPPMPQYRFNKRDATAIVAYLKSLPSSGSSAGSK
jgi:hypothetical protein